MDALQRVSFSLLALPHDLGRQPPNLYPDRWGSICVADDRSERHLSSTGIRYGGNKEKYTIALNPGIRGECERRRFYGTARIQARYLRLLLSRYIESRYRAPQRIYPGPGSFNPPVCRYGQGSRPFKT